ncbi:hypothetical protein SDC9_117196 [bioreactor metagenome]|uniref:Uncharacterized protein n=1 Tax=bioreactor metagenome TaxID=1076179 RepID=A0A645C4G5_9ZZZZ|nr:hypothetical protein [Erysipelotrichaceae bacterium]
MDSHCIEHNSSPGEEPVTIKIRVVTGCFHREHSPAAYFFIDQAITNIPAKERQFDFVEHESGPEIVAWIALGTAGFTLAKSVIDLVTAIINARAKGRERGDRPDGKLVLIVRDSHRTDASTEKFVMEIYDKELVSSKQVATAIEKGLQKRKSK